MNMEKVIGLATEIRQLELTLSRKRAALRRVLSTNGHRKHKWTYYARQKLSKAMKERWARKKQGELCQ